MDNLEFDNVDNFLRDIERGILTHLDIYNRLDVISSGFDLLKLKILKQDILFKIDEKDNFIAIESIGVEFPKKVEELESLKLNKFFLEKFCDYISEFIDIEEKRTNYKKPEKSTEVGVLLAQGLITPDPFKTKNLTAPPFKYKNISFNNQTQLIVYIENDVLGLSNLQNEFNKTFANDLDRAIQNVPSKIKKVMKTCMERNLQVSKEFQSIFDSLEN